VPNISPQTTSKKGIKVRGKKRGGKAIKLKGKKKKMLFLVNPSKFSQRRKERGLEGKKRKKDETLITI